MKINGFPQKQTRIFVASSSKTVDVANTLKRSLSSDKIVVVPWKELGVFPLSEHIIESLEKAANQCQFAIFVLGPDDVVQQETGESFVPRDNVVFELGLFLGKIGRKRSYMLKPHGIDIKLPSDLRGVTWAQYYSPGTTINDVREACLQIKYTMENAPMTPAVEILAATILPTIVIRHASRTFTRYVDSRLKFFARPRFKCDAQITVCNRKGRIIRHPRVSSLGHDVGKHEGKIIWSTFKIEDNSSPFKLLLKHPNESGWVVWTDSGYSQLYPPISGRHNHRICAARSCWKSARFTLLEIHQELANELNEQPLLELGHLIGARLVKVEDEE